MSKKLEEIKHMQDFKIYLDYPRVPEGENDSGLFKPMGFNTCTKNPDSVISWAEKENNLYLIRVSKECVKHIKIPRYKIDLPMMCEDLRFVKSTNLGHTRDGIEFITIEILMPGELSEQEEYRNSHPTKDEVYQQMRDEDYNNNFDYDRNDTEEDFRWGGLEGDEAHDAMWNCD